MQSYEQTANQVDALLDAYDYLLNQQPTDTVALAQVSQDIIALNARMRAIGLDSDAADPQPAIDTLSNAVDALNGMVAHNMAATAILKGVSAIMVL
ncbi:hypothetical protein [Burkholderia contaminans]|uniref:hypothetical protein n=1 Tax=Burkholderia contaminans TaxID=488447 RepID=UPI0008F4F5F3|nr:hypothetical protein [Burkholderia contaminans]